MNDDDHYIDLLEKLSKYNSLLEQLQKQMSDGFINLSRANFHNKDSLRGRYGSDYYDESYEGLIEIDIDSNGKINMVKKDDIVESAEETKIDDDEEGTTKSRKKKSETKYRTKKIRDPIMMFGAGLSVPSSLRRSQSTFKSSLSVLIELANCKRELLQNIDTITKTP